MIGAGAKLKKIRLRLGLTIREVERRGLKLVADRQNRDFNISRAWLTDIENGRFVPGGFKMVSLGEIYGLPIAEIQRFYGMQPGDIINERPVFQPPKTQLLAPPDENVRPGASAPTQKELESTNLVTRLVDIWGAVPVPVLRQLNLRRSLFGYIGTSDRAMSPLLPPGTIVQIDPKRTRVQSGPFQKGVEESQFARPIYFLDLRSGFACGWCEIKGGVLTLIPHPLSGEPTRTFRYPDEVDVVGRVTFIWRSIIEEHFTAIDEAIRRDPPKK